MLFSNNIKNKKKRSKSLINYLRIYTIILNNKYVNYIGLSMCMSFTLFKVIGGRSIIRVNLILVDIYRN